MDKFDHRRQFVVGRAAVAVSIGYKQYQHRTDPLAASADDIFSDLVDQADLGMEALADHHVDRVHIGGDRVGNIILWGGLDSGGQGGPASLALGAAIIP